MIPEGLSQDLAKHLEKIGVSSRQRSQWIEDAINRFLALEKRQELISQAVEMTNLKVRLYFFMSKGTRDKINEVTLLFKQDHPEIEGVQSKIVRASIMQKMLRDLVPSRNRDVTD